MPVLVLHDIVSEIKQQMKFALKGDDLSDFPRIFHPVCVTTRHTRAGR